MVGIVPRGVLEDESAHSELSELRMVDSMHERKQLMADQADAFLALPGGIGTLEELFEIWTWAQLGLHAKPIGLLNVEGYYDDLLSFVRGASREGFVRHTTEQKLTVGIDVESLLAQLGL